MSTRLYALRERGTDGIELRQCEDPPRRIVSGIKMGRRKVEQVVFEGGAKVGCVENADLMDTMCLMLVEGGCVLVPKRLERRLKQRAARSRKRFVE